MTTTHHPGGLAISEPDGHTVEIRDRTGIRIVLSKDDLVAIAIEHAVRRHKPSIGQSSFRSADAQILHARAATQRVEAEVQRLKRALEHVRSLGLAAHHVAGTPLALYADAALSGDTE